MEIRSILYISLILGLHSCSPKIQTNSGEVNFMYKEAQGTIVVKSIGYGINQSEAVISAEKNAFKVILFRGLPGTELNVPLITNEGEVTSKHAEYFNNLLEQGNYKSYMMSSIISSNLVKLKGTKKITVDIKINYNSLRKSLEQSQIVRKFGY
jgi:hypothetical protein